jgi:hypothetical protein
LCLLWCRLSRDVAGVLAESGCLVKQQ